MVKRSGSKGRIKAPGFFTDPIIKDAYCSAEWTGPSAGQLDPTKEVEAAEKRVQGGYSTREREARELTGTDFYKNIKQRKREEELLKEVTGGAKTDTQTVENINGREESDTENNPDNDGGQTEEKSFEIKTKYKGFGTLCRTKRETRQKCYCTAKSPSIRGMGMKSHQAYLTKS